MKIFVVALLGLAIALSTVPATAQDTKPAATDAKPKVGQRIGDWFFQCQALSANENISGLMQNFFDNRTKRQIVGVAVRYAGKGKDQRLGMFVTVPLGIFLGSGIGGKIDGEKQFKFNLQSCKAAKLQNCKAAKLQPAPLSGRHRDQGQAAGGAQKGKRLIIGFKVRANAKTIAVPVSLTGFSDGLKAILAKQAASDDPPRVDA